MAAETMIALHRLHRYFGATRAVDDVSFEVPRGVVFGYIGPNGAGKTTSMRILATLDLPTFGDAYVAGFSVVNDPDQVRRRLGYMPDSYGTYANVTCWEYLDFFARAYGLVGKQRRCAVERVIDFTGLRPLSEKPMTALSKGMKQRLCLGRALIHDPPVLVLDEPAAGLDPGARIELRDMIRQMADAGKTILVSSHILTELAEMCDRVAILMHGRLVAQGTVPEIQKCYEHVEDDAMSLLRIRVCGDVNRLREWFEQCDQYKVVSANEHTMTVFCPKNEERQAALLRELVLAGFPIVEFAPRATSLEDVFLKVTRGKAGI
ncbi:MAG: multidrug ABC transporter ATP-binding protein [Pirellulaceae bacterium]|nr:MAG: multidrug ABC transporter ATP-binding protein [Pirellulaceae bacterium]